MSLRITEEEAPTPTSPKTTAGLQICSSQAEGPRGA